MIHFMLSLFTQGFKGHRGEPGEPGSKVSNVFLSLFSKEEIEKRGVLNCMWFSVSRGYNSTSLNLNEISFFQGEEGKPGPPGREGSPGKDVSSSVILLDVK